jgi:predicted ATP-grasp superfamily ATP-dependent carboligase
MSDRHVTPAVVAGLNLNGLGVARALGRNGVSVVGVTDGSHGFTTWTRYLWKSWPCREGQDGLVQTLLDRAGQLPAKPVLFLITDNGVRACADRLEELRACYHLAMPEPSLVRTLLDKRGFAQTAEQLAMPAPRTFFIDRPEQMADAAAQVPYPCIMKPQVKSRAYSAGGGKKAYLLPGRDELLRAYEKFSHAEPRVVVQEFISGGDEDVYFCLQYYDAAGKASASFTGHKIRQWPPLCGGTAACEPVHSPELVELTTRFFSQVGFFGLCSMEYKRDARDGRFLMIEPTVCRTDWQSAVADINGLPIPYVAYCDQVGLPRPRSTPPKKPIKWVYLSSDRLSADYYRKQGRLGRLGWLRSLRPPVQGAVWAWDDPMPFLAVVAGKVAAKVRALLGRFRGSRPPRAARRAVEGPK